MKRKTLFTSLAAALLLFSGSGVLAADMPQAAFAGAKSEAAADMGDIKNENGKEKQAEKEKQPEKEKLAALRSDPLAEADFVFSDISLGSSADALKELKGNPKKVIRGDVQDEYQWDDMAVTVNKTLPAMYSGRQDLKPERKGWQPGISTIYLSGKAAVTARGIGVGSLRENVLRSYGKPEQVLWEGGQGSFILRYTADGKGLDFGIKDNKVSSIKVYVDRENKKQPAPGYMELAPKGGLSEADFRLAGYTLGEPFKAHPFDTWIKKMTNPKEEIWYYDGYAVRVNRAKNMIEAYFLEGNNMLTRRGMALGDSLSTVEMLYGKPGKVELESSSGNLRNAYVYFSPTKDKILIIYISKGKADGFIIAENPQKQRAAAGRKK